MNAFLLFILKFLGQCNAPPNSFLKKEKSPGNDNLQKLIRSQLILSEKFPYDVIVRLEYLIS
jgi:hypothetical protein